MKRENLTRFAWLSIATAILTIALKTAAYWLTGSIGLLSDALESAINLAAAVVALLILRAAAAPPDEEHAYGHDKAEFFSSAIEGTLIIIAAVSIAWAASPRLVAPRPLESVGIGLIISSIATAFNLAVGLILLRVGKKYNSITLEADGKHLLVDVWTSIGVVFAVFAVSLTGWLFLDPLIALVVAANILWTGFRLLNRSAHGLMDRAISQRERETVARILDEWKKREGIQFHALRTRQAATRKFIDLHVLVPGDWTVHRGHELLEQIESDIRAKFTGAIVLTHLESLDDPASWEDIDLDRPLEPDFH
jgi:cation diffusion facilitator family transporter